ncbi:hypothetical protein HT665_06525 [Ursidibacter maritimus]|uniref:Uncharacterized protein n=1 Tax=Ursidibacter maritimus TaxID=1331689 RepID=A0A949T3V1_9PAST|nr:hypothetical protein [Ursidibacter maritimus]KAE9538749.1 hypothetical protein A1D26_05600 [Ursidibacter maritimus]MBV6523370.1 hypothetical protein [Ursidibacter maritimus]MBV6526445.1 hypothetical protein [Ursidibacter maritimus]MBV6527776.1 hypothetical protein [Ursidibacter maritimus]MBV6529797.1 hypothetical protein [Ursidibacter maritimus]
MSFFFKLFSKFFTKAPQQDFILHSIHFETPESETLTDGDFLWATIDFESKYDCQLWLLPVLEHPSEAGSSLGGGYMPSDVLPSGRHQIKRYFYFNNIDAQIYPNGLKVVGTRIRAMADTQMLYEEVHSIHYQYLPFSAEVLAERQAADKENLKVEFVSVSCQDRILSPNDSISVGSSITVRIHTPNDDLTFCCFAKTDSSFGYNPMTSPYEGKADLSFTMHEIGEISGFAITAYNRYDILIDTLDIDFPLQVEDWRDDGKDQAVRFDFDGAYDATPDENKEYSAVSEGSTISSDREIRLYTYLNHQAKHGASIKIYDIVNGAINEELYQSSIINSEACKEENYYFYSEINWENVDFSENPVYEVSGFYLVLLNIADEVLAEQVIDFPLTIHSEE